LAYIELICQIYVTTLAKERQFVVQAYESALPEADETDGQNSPERCQNRTRYYARDFNPFNWRMVQKVYNLTHPTTAANVIFLFGYHFPIRNLYPGRSSLATAGVSQS